MLKELGGIWLASAIITACILLAFVVALGVKLVADVIFLLLGRDDTDDLGSAAIYIVSWLAMVIIIELLVHLIGS